MAYAGIATMLLAYKMRKSDKEFDLTKISQDMTIATRQSSQYVEDFEATKNAYATEFGGTDNAEYQDALQKLTDKHDLELAEIASWEDELEQRKSNCETEISMLNGYINSWQAALQQNVAKDHTYGAQQ